LWIDKQIIDDVGIYSRPVDCRHRFWGYGCHGKNEGDHADASFSAPHHAHIAIGAEMKNTIAPAPMSAPSHIAKFPKALAALDPTMNAETA
jgi:hypothetical protein